MLRIHLIFPPLLLLLGVLISPAHSICEQSCERISTLLSSCSLPPLSTDHTTIDDTRPADTSRVNITGVESTFFAPSGPTTNFLESIADAECFCTETRRYFRYPCEQCFLTDILESGEDKPRDNNWEVLGRYSNDCYSFGYFENETLAYPSTTRSALPAAFTASDVETGTEDTDTDTNTDTCQNVCGLIRSQADECRLTSLDAEHMPPVVSIISGPYTGRVLLNRTAGECMCTLPVLRRTRGCRWCMQEGPDDGSLAALDAYQHECTALGYYGDAAVVGSVEEVEAIEAAASFEESELGGPGPTPTGAGAVLRVSVRGTFACWVGVLFVLFGLI